MLKIKVKLSFLSDDRKNAITSGYRPAFKFGDEYLTGSIELLEKKALHQGEKSLAEIFIIQDFLIKNNLEIGQVVSFYEPPYKIGDAELLGWERIIPE
jgi:hypothetical protein